MGELVNLRTVRKRRVRAEQAADAEQNRLLFGRTKAEKQRQQTEKARAEKHIDGHKREE